ncbi:HAMP domain-containing sensor histidine kinase [Eubacterium sp.]|uniref:sensor histidine kinase n=1 Tax=Eubacterium sp. TaxID=142586 RepID=UPI0026E099AD|nr:HAMP domain-containing sensor histidine kinase [Eubacterium sp.]MDO5432213.1 HAMP domain-containing sensor histidine kinase [Eubacterium sp.]
MMRKRSIAFKLGLYFSLALLAFALVAGSVFFLLFKKQNVALTQKQLEDRAGAIADTFGTFISAEGSRDGKHGEGSRGAGNGNGMGYAAYIRFLDDIAMADVWVVDADHNLVTPSTHEGHQTPASTYNYADLPADAETVVDQAFGGQVTASEGFSGLLNAPTLTVGAPVRDSSGNIQAVVLLHSPVEGIESAANEGFRTLAISLCVALVIGIGFAVLLARSFTKPMKEMQVMAGRLAGGDYTAASHIKRQDEIGQLAGSLDTLSHQLKLSSEEHERFQKMQQAFFSNISHELKTPVTVLCGSLEALAGGVVTDPAQVAAYHQEMYAESLALKRLVNDLLDLSRLQNAEFSLNLEQVNLCDIISEVRRSAQNMAKEKELTVTTEVDTGVYFMQGDYLRLRQLLMIAMSNAIKFSPGGGQIEMRLSEHTLTITDHGCGISAEDQKHIFERFYKTLSEENAEGTGLGLPIAKEIAERHKIGLTVTSEEGQGTTVTLELPGKENTTV